MRLETRMSWAFAVAIVVAMMSGAVFGATAWSDISARHQQVCAVDDASSRWMICGLFYAHQKVASTDICPTKDRRKIGERRWM